MIIFNKEELETLILTDKLSYIAIGKLYGCSDSYIKKKALQLGINVPVKRVKNPCETFDNTVVKNRKTCIACGIEFHARHSTKYCSNQCQRDLQYINFINAWRSETISGTTASGVSGTIRRYLFEKHNNSCSKCGWNSVNPISNKVPLEVHHIDGDYQNNKESNLELLCPNCHSLTPNYKALNKCSNPTRYKNFKL